MVAESDKAPGSTQPARSSPWRVLAVLAALVSAAAIAFWLGRTSAPSSPESDNRSNVQSVAPVAAQATNQAAATNKPSAANPTAAPAATDADFLITDQLLANPRVYDDFQSEAVRTSVCLGDPLRIANVASRRVGLTDTPEASDATVSLGVVEPGAVFTLRPEDSGTFYISAAGVDGLLFRYVAERCRGR